MIGISWEISSKKSKFLYIHILHTNSSVMVNKLIRVVIFILTGCLTTVALYQPKLSLVNNYTHTHAHILFGGWNSCEFFSDISGWCLNPDQIQNLNTNFHGRLVLSIWMLAQHDLLFH